MLRRFCLTVALLCGASSSVWAQGLIWSLPKDDGASIKFEGTYQQTEQRPGSNDGPLTLEWASHLWVKSVGQEEADYKGEKTPCRWIEIKVVTGRINQGAIDTGSVGERIYKVLVPEKVIAGRIKDDRNLPIVYLPIVKGFRKVNGKDPAAKPITSSVLQIYPVLGLVRDFKELEESPGMESVQVGNETVEAKEYKGNLEQESLVSRFTHEAKFYRSKDVPFGLARWTVTINQERKAEAEPRSAFKPVCEIKLEMTAREIATDAKSELITDPAAAPVGAEANNANQ